MQIKAFKEYYPNTELNLNIGKYIAIKITPTNTPKNALLIHKGHSLIPYIILGRLYPNLTINTFTMRHNLLLLVLLCSILSYSQHLPEVMVGDTLKLSLASLKINIEITGSQVGTTYDMMFKNGLDRDLEGQLSFPLSEGQSVAGFAMEMNGALRESVVVEKELARKAFETTVRQTIDPGLLEKTEGNNYSARIYPIPANGLKQVIIRTEQEMQFNGKEQVFNLPIIKDSDLSNLEIIIEILGVDSGYSIENKEQNGIVLKKNQKGLYANYNYKGTSLTTDLKIIRTNFKDPLSLNHENYFYISTPLSPKTRKKSKPSQISILWDRSSSMRHRNLEKELDLIDRYLQYLGKVQIELVAFNNTVDTIKTYNIIRGDWENLKQDLINTIYDGGTSFPSPEMISSRSEEIILLSDGLENLTDDNFPSNRKVYLINTNGSANHQKLTSIANAAGGNYINLGLVDTQIAYERILLEPYQFLGTVEDDNLYEIYPDNKQIVNEGFSISGMYKQAVNIKMLFGYNNKATDTLTVAIGNNRSTDYIKRLWAKKKLGSLELEKNENREKIISLAKQFGLITDFTSMLILDRIEDYVRYRIEPPKEMRRLYKSLVAEQEEQETMEKMYLNDRIEEIKIEYKEIAEWYGTKFPVKKPEKKKVQSEEPIQINNSNQVATESVPERATEDNLARTPLPVRIELDLSKPIISGMVKDERGVPLAGVNVIVKGTSRNAQTDFDGIYKINANEEDSLVYSYIGMNSIEREIGDKNEIDVVLSDNRAVLDEVVVTAYSVKTEHTSLSSTVARTLSGKAAGVDIIREDDSVNDGVLIRGASSLNGNSQALFIIDGVPSGENPLNNLNSNDIESISVLKDASATHIYGSRGANGVIVITTKEGLEKNANDIQEFEEMVQDRIELKEWKQNAPYMDILRKQKSGQEVYDKYLEIRNNYFNTPSFYIDVSDILLSLDDQELAMTVTSNLAEISLDNYELLRALGYKLDASGNYKQAAFIYERILELRPEDPQSYRDLALALEETGDIQRSFELLYQIYNGELLEKDEDELYLGITSIVYMELSRLVNKYPDQIDLPVKSLGLLKNFDLDVRVVIDWNHKDTDIDLWVIDPNGEKASYKNLLTKQGGRMSEDMTDGFGPEEFMLKNAKKGLYTVIADYYSDDMQKISGPSILKATIYENYGRPNESKRIKVFTLGNEEDEFYIDTIIFD